MKPMVEVTVLRSVLVSDDGITTREIVKDTDDKVLADQFPGLKAEGYVTEPSPPAAEDTGPDIPADWMALHHATKKKIARLISGADADTTDAAEAVIAAEVERRAAA